MADDVTLNTMTGGDVIGADEIAGVKYQRVKIIAGANGTNDGDVCTATPLPIAGTVTADLSATDNAVLDTIDAAIDAINAKLVTGTVIGDVNLGATDNAVLDTIDAAIDAINAKLVTGTVIGDVNLGATDNAVLDTIDAAIDAINAKLVHGTDIGDVTINNTSIAVTAASGALAAGSVSAGAVVSGAILSGALASGSIASGALAAGSIAAGAVVSGAILSGALASGAISSGAIASGAIVAGAIVAGDTSIATTEDTARAAGEHLVKIGASRLDAPVANANCADNDYTNLLVDNFGKLWVAGAAIEDTAETAGMSVMVAGAVRRDALASSSTTDGDVSTLNTNATGALWVCPSGHVAHDATDSGNPIKIGAKVESTPSAQVCADTDRTDLLADMDGALLVRTECTIGDLLTESISNTNGTATASAVFTTGAGVRNVICNIVAYNSSATGGFCLLTDGSGGTTLMTVPLPAGGGCVIPLGGAPIKTTANTALYFDVSGALTTVYLTFTGYRTKVT